MLVSAADDADLMEPASWTATPPLPFDMAWLADLEPAFPIAGYLEGALHTFLCTQAQWSCPARCGAPSSIGWCSLSRPENLSILS